MSELSSEQRDAVIRGLDALDSRGLPYVVLRRHEHLPEAIPGDTSKILDVDILVDADQLDHVVTSLEGEGFQMSSAAMWTWLTMARKAARKPVKATRMLLSQPGEVVRRVLGPVERKVHRSRSRRANGDSTRSGVDPEPDAPEPSNNARLEHLTRLARQGGHAIHLLAPEAGIKFDVKNHLSHISPLNAARIQLDPQVETWMLQGRIVTDTHAHPAPPDELAHIVAHGVFEYEGTFPAYYRERLDRLAKATFDGGESEAHLAEILDTVFFRAGGLVKDRIEEGAYDRIRPDLFRFSDY